METADVVQADVRFYLEPVATADGYRTVPLESREGAPMVLYGRRATPEMGGQVRIDGELDNKLGCVGCRERGQHFQEEEVFNPPGRVEFDILNDLTPIGREFVGCGVEFHSHFRREFLVGGPKADVERRVGATVKPFEPFADGEKRLDHLVKRFLFQHLENIVPADKKSVEGPDSL